MKYCQIAFLRKIGDQETLTYSIPPSLMPKVGQTVSVPIRGKATVGIVWKIHENQPSFKTHPIQEIVSEKPLLSGFQISLIKWMSQYYFTPIFKVLKLFIPKRVFENKPVRQRKTIKEQKYSSKDKPLTEEQKSTIEQISKSPKNKFLIHGVTGSGKTEIYVQLARPYLEKGQQVLILVPEISLTPQTIHYFENALEQQAATIHSKLSEGQRYQAWTNIHQRKANLVIGSRSSLFAPFQNLGLIIIDEEHEHSYKQDQAPRYSVHRVVEEITKLSPKTKIVFGSATPSIETREKLAETTIKLTKRIGDSILPEISIVDLREEFKKKNYSIFSEELAKEMHETLKNKKQIILFLNRRGSSSSVVCRDCGHSEKCANCDATMTYHSSTFSKPSLVCHHCGKISEPPTICPQCQGPNIRFLGIGTQRIEEEVRKEFPSARILRADRDTTSKKNSFKEIYEAFKKHEADILIGTQMIAKGLHIPAVDLVGVILADIGISIPDFRTAERNFQLMTQVAGRAGRSGQESKVIIQTYNPDHFALLSAQRNDYAGFFNYERQQRQLLKNPPFSKLAKILISNKSHGTSQETQEKVERLLWQIAREENIAKEIEINSYPAYFTRLNNKFRQIILLKSTNLDLIHALLGKLPKEYIMNPDIKIDIDPISTV